MLRDYALKSYDVMNFYIKKYKDDMREVIETVAKYRSPSPAETINNFTFIQPFEATGEVVSDSP